MTPPFRLRASEPSDIPHLVALQHASHPLHPWSTGELERDLVHLEPRLQHRFLVAERDGIVVGAAHYQRSAASYHPYRFLLSVWVEPGSRSQGLGRALYDAAMDELRGLEAQALTTQVHEGDPRALRFAQDRGFRELKRDFLSLLAVDRFDAQAHRGPEERLRGEGVTLATFRELDSPVFRHHFHDVFETVRVDTPRVEPPVPLTFEFFNANVLEDPEMVPEAFVFALTHGRVLGFTGGYRGAEPAFLDTWLTAVVREARGRGIATALKVRSIRNVAALGIATIRTDNDTRNQPMLRVNERLGFQRQPAVITLGKSL